MKQTAEPRTEERGAFQTVAKNSIFLLMSTTLGIVVRLATIPIIARYLGVEQFGYYSLIMAISLSITPIVELGLDRILCRELAKDDAHKERYFSTAVILRTALSLFWLFLSCIALEWFSPWSREINFAVIVGIVGQLILSIGMTYLAAVWAFERMEFDVLVNIVYHSGSIVTLLLAIFFGLGLIGILYARLLSSLIYLAIAAIFIYWLFIKPVIQFDFKFSKSIIKEALPVALFTFLISLIFKVDVFLLQWLGTSRDIALFEAPHRLATQLQILATTINISIFPLLVRSSVADETGVQNKYYGEAEKYLLIIGMFLSVYLFIGGKSLVVLIFGNEFVDATISLKILSPVVVLLFLTTLQSMFLLAVGRQNLNIITTGISLAVNFILGILLIPAYHHIGASIGTVIAYALLAIVGAYFIAKNGIKYNYALTGKMIIIGIVTSVAALIELSGNISTLAARSVVSVMVYVAMLFAFKIVTKDDFYRILKLKFLKKRA